MSHNDVKIRLIIYPYWILNGIDVGAMPGNDTLIIYPYWILNMENYINSGVMFKLIIYLYWILNLWVPKK